MNQSERTKGAAAYLLGPITGIYFLLTEKQNNFVRFHAMQSTLIFGFIILLEIVLELVPILGKFISYLLYPVFNTLIFIFWLVILWKAWNGEKYKVKFFGEIAEKQLERLN